MSAVRSEPWCKKDHKTNDERETKSHKNPFNLNSHCSRWAVEPLTVENRTKKLWVQKHKAHSVLTAYTVFNIHYTLTLKITINRTFHESWQSHWWRWIDGKAKEKYVKSKPCQELWFFVFRQCALFDVILFDGQFSFFFSLTFPFLADDVVHCACRKWNAYSQ